MKKITYPRVGLGVLLINDSGEVLMGRRHDDKEKADSELHGEGTWTIPGGKLEFQESLFVGACREVKEETGLLINEKDLKLISVSNDRVPDAHFITLGFLSERFEGIPKVMEPDEITEWRWFPLKELPSPIFSPTRKVLDNYLSKHLVSD